jgi:hypothetical protein
MRRLAFYLDVFLLTFLIGIAPVLLYRVMPSQLPVVNQTQFIPTGSLLQPDYTIHWFTIPGSSDYEAITFFSDLGSEEKTRHLFESNADAWGGKLLERREKLNAAGRRIGERGIVVGDEYQWARIFWTEGKDFWCIQAPSLELALEFERSELMQSAKSNNGMHPTADTQVLK